MKKGKNKTVTLSVTIDVNARQIKLLTDISNDDGFEPEEMTKELEEDLGSLCEKQLVESILGEQFYITALGKSYLKQVKKS